jgi:hypothetical protein
MQRRHGVALHSPCDGPAKVVLQSSAYCHLVFPAKQLGPASQDASPTFQEAVCSAPAKFEPFTIVGHLSYTIDCV